MVAGEKECRSVPAGMIWMQIFGCRVLGPCPMTKARKPNTRRSNIPDLINKAARIFARFPLYLVLPPNLFFSNYKVII